jgi:RND family efflux transporter MFP subunit
LSDEALGTDKNSDKRELLQQLKIDRSAPRQTNRARPVKWFLLIALVAGGGFVLWFFDLPGTDLPGTDQPGGLPVATAVAESLRPMTLSSGGSVLDATGYIVARRQATVSSKTTGKVMEVLIEEGLVVEKDQLLARLDDSIPRAQLNLAQSQYESARAGLSELEIQLQQVQLDLERTKGLAERNLASKADLDADQLTVEGLIARLGRARKDIVVAQRTVAVQQQIVEDMQIRAPFAGIVIAKAAQPGEMISPVSAGGGFTRTGICTIVDMESLEVEVDVNESYINRVYSGQPVSVTLNAYPDDQYAAFVIAIIPAADRNKATVRVRVGLIDRNDRILPDMGVRVAFLEDTQDSQVRQTDAPEGVMIPADAVVQQDSNRLVYVVSGGQVSIRNVVVAERSGSRIRVTEGLRAGERVVASLDQDLLDRLSDGVAVTSK